MAEGCAALIVSPEDYKELVKKYPPSDADKTKGIVSLETHPDIFRQ